jgi:hypothetical protein
VLAGAPALAGAGIVGLCILLATSLDNDTADEEDKNACKEKYESCINPPVA